MRVLVSPTAFKGTLGAAEAAAAMAAGVRAAMPDARVREMPLSDGGPGLLDALGAAARARATATTEDDAGAEGGRAPETVTVEVRGPRGGPVRGRLLFTGESGDVAGARSRTAAMESADACGLHLLAPEARDPLVTDTAGVGDLLRAAAARGARRALAGLGGSGTCDGGTGMARALGWRFLGDAGGELPPGGGHLARLARVEAPPASGGGPPADPDPATGQGDGAARAAPLPLAVTALADVRNPLLGPDGAAPTFAPQKGAEAAGVETLEAGLRRLVEVLEASGTVRSARELAAAPGAGAAGGLGFGMAAFTGAELVSGTGWVLERCGFDGALAAAGLVVTGEGAFDRTTGMGKVVGEVVRRARERGVPVILACGRIEGDPPEDLAAGDGGGKQLDARGLARLVARLARRGVREP